MGPLNFGPSQDMITFLPNLTALIVVLPPPPPSPTHTHTHTPPPQDHPPGPVHTLWSGHWLLLQSHCAGPDGVVPPPGLPHCPPSRLHLGGGAWHIFQEGRCVMSVGRTTPTVCLVHPERLSLALCACVCACTCVLCACVCTVCMCVYCMHVYMYSVHVCLHVCVCTMCMPHVKPLSQGTSH